MKHIDLTLDTSGLICPLPLLKTKQKLAEMEAGQRVQVICTDPSSVIDFKVFAEVTAHKLLETSQRAATYYFLIEKASC